MNKKIVILIFGILIIIFAGGYIMLNNDSNDDKLSVNGSGSNKTNNQTTINETQDNIQSTDNYVSVDKSSKNEENPKNKVKKVVFVSDEDIGSSSGDERDPNGDSDHDRILRM
jgi:mannitol-specific phosphotransferase system IIBC component